MIDFPKLLPYVFQQVRQLTLTPREFAEKYGWKNDPEKVRLVPAEPQDDKEKSGNKPTTNDRESDDNN